jgi:hypothetical protein
MRKTGLLIAIIVVLVGASAQAQKKSAKSRILPPPLESQKVVVQDDYNAGYLLFHLGTGEYEFVMCEYGYTLSGKAEVKIDGCTVYFSDIQDTYRALATLDLCEQQGKCGVEMFKHPDLNYEIEPIQVSWWDSNMRNNTAQCLEEKK